MPSKSKAQRNFMAAAAHNPAFAKKAGIPTSVAKEFNQADKGKKFRQGGIMKDDIKQDKAMAKKAVGMHEKQLHGGKKSDLTKLKKGGMCKGYADGGSVKDVPEDDKPPVDKKGKYIKPRPYAKGGVAKTVTKEMEYDYKTGKKSFAGSTAKKDAHAEKEGKRVAKDLAYDKAKKFARGGGIEVRGKTRGKMC
jgi:hypothetical protein